MKKNVIIGIIAAFVLTILLLFGIKLPPEVADMFEDMGIEIPKEMVQYPESDIDTAHLPKTPKTFVTAKNKLYDNIYFDHQLTFYCGCSYENRQVDHQSCDYKVLSNENRAKRTEAEHIMPAYAFGHYRACWQEELCTDKDGKAFKGRSCCEEIDPVFHIAHNDLHNLTPAIGEVNGNRSNYTFGMIEGEKREYGACDMEIDSEQRLAEPPEEVRGDIARAYLYMAQTYEIPLTDTEKALFESWHQQDPVSEWEKLRNQRIQAIQGNYNSFIGN